MTTKNLTANGKIALAPTYALTPAHRDDAGNVHVFVKGLNTWRLVNESAHLFRLDTDVPAPVEYTPPATWHPGRCFCPKFAPGHTPGLEPRYGSECTGDTDVEHDATSCPACLAGATDYRPRIEPGQIWISQYGTDHEVIERADDARHEMWEMRGPVGNLYVITAWHLYTNYTLDLDR